MYNYLIVGSGLFGAIFANEANKKGPTAIGPNENKNIKVNPNICTSRRKYTQKCDIG